MKLNKFAYLYSKPLGNHTLKIMKKIPGNLLKNLEKSWNFCRSKKVGTLGRNYTDLTRVRLQRAPGYNEQILLQRNH